MEIKKCVKCGYVRDDELDKDTPDYECPRCGVIYSKAEKTSTRHLPEPPPTQKTNKKLRPCAECGVNISKNAYNCPYCGAIVKKGPGVKKTIWGVLAILFIFSVIGSFIEKKRAPEPVSTSISTVNNKTKTSQEKAAERAKKVIERKRERARKNELCKKDLKCWGNKHDFSAIVAAEKKIERLAKYDFEWTDGWGGKISKFRWLDKDALTVTYIGDKIKFQNGFGAWKNMIYQIDYNPIVDVVLDVRVHAGRLPD